MGPPKERFWYGVYLVKGDLRLHSKTYKAEYHALAREEKLERWFGPLGYTVEIEVTPRGPLLRDKTTAPWGDAIS